MGYLRSKKEEGETKGHVDEFWFLTDPEDFNFLCHPEEPDKQLMSSPWTTEIFLNLPGLKADFFKSDWKLLGPHTAVVETNNGKSSIDFQVGLNKGGRLECSCLCGSFPVDAVCLCGGVFCVWMLCVATEGGRMIAWMARCVTG